MNPRDPRPVNYQDLRDPRPVNYQDLRDPRPVTGRICVIRVP
jgi:hypothetical protein